MRTPEDLREELLSSYHMSEAEKLTKAKRKLTEEEPSKLIQGTGGENYFVELIYH